MDSWHLWQKVVKLSHVPNILLILILHILINTVRSGHISVGIFIEIEDSSETLIGSFLNGNNRFEDQVHGVRYLVDRPKRFLDRDGNDYNPPTFEIPDWQKILEQHKKQREEQEKRRKEEEERRRIEKEEETQMRERKNIITVVVVLVLFIGITVGISVCVKYHNAKMNRRNTEFASRIGNMQTSSSHSSANVPAANLHNNPNNNSSNNDLPPSYDEAVAHIQLDTLSDTS